jgi:hypothetical protein
LANKNIFIFLLTKLYKLILSYHTYYKIEVQKKLNVFFISKLLYELFDEISQIHFYLNYVFCLFKNPQANKSKKLIKGRPSLSTASELMMKLCEHIDALLKYFSFSIGQLGILYNALI